MPVAVPATLDSTSTKQARSASSRQRREPCRLAERRPRTTVDWNASLLARNGSGELVVTRAVFVCVPGSVALTTSETKALARAGRVPRLQVTVCPPLQLPWPAATVTNSSPGGRVSVSWTLVAVAAVWLFWTRMP